MITPRMCENNCVKRTGIHFWKKIKIKTKIMKMQRGLITKTFFTIDFKFKNGHLSVLKCAVRGIVFLIYYSSRELLFNLAPKQILISSLWHLLSYASTHTYRLCIQKKRALNAYSIEKTKKIFEILKIFKQMCLNVLVFCVATN